MDPMMQQQAMAQQLRQMPYQNTGQTPGMAPASNMPPAGSMPAQVPPMGATQASNVTNPNKPYGQM